MHDQGYRLYNIEGICIFRALGNCAISFIDRHSQRHAQPLPSFSIDFCIMFVTVTFLPDWVHGARSLVTQRDRDQRELSLLPIRHLSIIRSHDRKWAWSRPPRMYPLSIILYCWVDEPRIPGMDVRIAISLSFRALNRFLDKDPDWWYDDAPRGFLCKRYGSRSGGG